MKCSLPSLEQDSLLLSLQSFAIALGLQLVESSQTLHPLFILSRLVFKLALLLKFSYIYKAFLIFPMLSLKQDSLT
jgi:hypothetical protein